MGFVSADLSVAYFPRHYSGGKKYKGKWGTYPTLPVCRLLLLLLFSSEAERDEAQMTEDTSTSIRKGEGSRRCKLTGGHYYYYY